MFALAFGNRGASGGRIWKKVKGWITCNGSRVLKSDFNMIIVMTQVPLKPNSYEKCADLFERSNPGLVEGEEDWLSARMMFDHASDTVTVLATWTTAEAYQTFSAGSDFQAAMAQFAPMFAGAPKVTVNEVLVEMGPVGVGA